MAGETWPGEPEEQENTAVLALMTGVALGLQVIELITVPDWGLGCGRAGASDALTLLTGVTWPGVTCWVEMQWVEATPEAGVGPGSTLPESMLLPLPVLKCGCVREQVV